tara:strand:+ start:34061 stop:35941 length:1881 start_codon:yes stop_codon:yes gene_type:complete
MAEKKKKLLFQSDFSLAKTGFGRNARAVLSYLYSTNKYEILHYCCGIPQSNPALKRTPWKSVGTLPSDERQMEELSRDPQVARMAAYGSHLLDQVVKEFKPDVYIAVQDIWGIDFAIPRPWFNKIESALWTTLDSLPILPTAINAAKKVDNFWVWSNFAEKDMKKQGLENVKTLHGALDEKFFYKLDHNQRMLLRSKAGLTPNDFVIGFVFRNQLRKSVPNLLEGFSLLKKQQTNKNLKLLLHTNFSEGWNIHKLADEYGVDHSDILTTHKCDACGDYTIRVFKGQGAPCSNCGKKDGVHTTSINLGVSEKELNEVYNVMDVYCHPFTSGGQEIPIQEAKLAELITLVTNYSCGEEMCEEEACSLPLEWSEYREHNTEFKKASTCPKSIQKQLSKVLEMSDSEKQELGKRAREWTIKNFSKNTVGKFLEDFIDSCDYTNYDFNFENIKKDPNAEIPQVEDNAKWITCLYEKILKRENVLDDDEGHRYWMTELSKGSDRKSIENYFRQVAIKENSESRTVKMQDVLSENENRILFIAPKSGRGSLISTSLLKSIKDDYKDHDVYVACQNENQDLFHSNENVHKVIPFSNEMDDMNWLKNLVNATDYFKVVYSSSFFDNKNFYKISKE